MAKNNSPEQIMKNLQKIARQAVIAERKAVEAGAKLFAERLERNTPYANKNKTALSDNVVYTKAKDEAGIFSEVGYGKETSFRMHFPNFGSINQRPQNFVEKTVRESQREVVSTMEKVMRKEMSKI